MREETCDFLLYEALNMIVEEVQPITDAYTKRLGSMNRPERLLPPGDMQELGEVQIELGDIERSLRPLRQVISHLKIEQVISKSTRMYLEGLEDDIDAAIDD